MPLPPLTHGVIDAAETERRATELLNEFFKSYFDGAAHDAGTGPLTFPACEIGFNQVTPQMNLPLIHTVYASLRATHEHQAPAGVQKRRFQLDALLNIFVRVKNEGQAAVGADATCRTIASYLKLVFDSRLERKRLTQKGILHPVVQSGPTPQPFPAMQVRLLVVTMQLVYRLE